VVVRPLQNIDFIGSTEWDHYDLDINKADLALDLSIDRSGNRKDRLKLDYKYDKNEENTLNFYIHLNLVYGFSAGSLFRRDLNDNHNISTDYWVEYASQCWSVRAGVEKENGETTATFMIRLTGLGDIRAY